MKNTITLVLSSLALASCAPAIAEIAATPKPVADQENAVPSPAERRNAMPPRILDETKATMLRENTGITLQWLSWDDRGTAQVTVGDDGVWQLSAAQTNGSGARGNLSVEGVITEVGSDYFLLDGRIAINDTPDAGRRCTANKVWRFGITQGRQYWRMREFEWCDGLTDYIDIYF